MRWDLTLNLIHHGSWFHGSLHPWLSDLSWDGAHMVYVADGLRLPFASWTGICEPPKLKTLIHWEHSTSQGLGGGVWLSADEVTVREPVDRGDGEVPFKVRRAAPWFSEMGNLIDARLERDGWKRMNRDLNHQLWSLQSDVWPGIRLELGLTNSRIEKVVFSLDGASGIWGEDASVALSADGSLLAVDHRLLRRFAPGDSVAGRPSFKFDLSTVQKPPKKPSDRRPGYSVERFQEERRQRRIRREELDG